MRILFITATRIGDAVISTGLLRHLVEQYDGAKLTVACGPLAQSLFAAVPGIEDIIVLDKRRFGGHWLSLWSRVIGRQWDLVVDLRRSLTSYCLLTPHRAILGPDDDRSHRVELLSGLLDLNPPSGPKIWTQPEHDDAAASLLPANKPVIAFAPVAARPEKTWPVDRFVDLANQLTRKGGHFEDACIVTIGGEADRPSLDAFTESLAVDTRLELIGCPDLLTVFAVLRRSSLIVANDSGLAHLGAATGQPTVALFGPTRPDLYRPWGPNTAVAQGEPSDGRPAMTDLSVDSAYRTIKGLLSSQAGA